jgi:hypothetical protein
MAGRTAERATYRCQSRLTLEWQGAFGGFSFAKTSSSSFSTFPYQHRTTHRCSVYDRFAAVEIESWVPRTAYFSRKPTVEYTRIIRRLINHYGRQRIDIWDQLIKIRATINHGRKKYNQPDSLEQLGIAFRYTPIRADQLSACRQYYIWK